MSKSHVGGNAYKSCQLDFKCHKIHHLYHVYGNQALQRWLT